MRFRVALNFGRGAVGCLLVGAVAFIFTTPTVATATSAAATSTSASATEITGIKNRVPTKCEVSEGDVNDIATRWLNATLGAKVPKYKAPPPPDLYVHYLHERYKISVDLDERSRVVPAFVAALEDLPITMRNKLGRLILTPGTQCEDSSRMSLKKGGVLSVCDQNDGVKSMDFGTLKMGFVHEMGHRYAELTDGPDFKREWLNLSHWRPTGERRKSCHEQNHKACDIYVFPAQMELGAKWDNREISVVPGFVSPYAVAAPYEDYAETFTHYRYSQDFYARAEADSQLKSKLDYMTNQFGIKYNSYPDCLGQGFAGGGPGGAPAGASR